MIIPGGKPDHHPSLMVPRIGVLVRGQNSSSPRSVEKPIRFGDTLFQLARGNVGKMSFESPN